MTGTLVHLRAAGSCTLTASQPGDDNYNPASDVTQSFNIALGNQSITFPALHKMALGSADFVPNATASSGLPVTFTAHGSCSVVSGAIHLASLGKCTVTAFQMGNASWNPATDVTRKFNVTAAPTSTSLSATSPVSSGGTITLIATVNSALGGLTNGTVEFFTKNGTLLTQIPISAGSATAYVQAPASPTTVKIYAKYVPVPHSDWMASKSSTQTVHVT